MLPLVTGADPAALGRAALDDEDGSALLATIAGGDARARAAEAALCRRYAPRIRVYGLRHLRDPDAAADLVQIVLLAVLESARKGGVREPEHLERFILGTCRNASLRLRQTGNRAQPTERDKLETLLVSEVDEPAALDGRALARCLDGLEARARQVVTMAFREDRSADEIAGELRTTAGNVRVIRHRALASLRLCIEGRGGAM